MSGTTSTGAVVYEVPLNGYPQQFRISISGTVYTLRFVYRNALMGGWQMDIMAANGNPIVLGIPLVTGTDLLEQFHHYGLGDDLTGLYIVTDTDFWAPPTFDNLGSTSHLYLVSNVKIDVGVQPLAPGYLPLLGSAPS